MKFAIAIFALLVVALTGTQSAEAPPTANSVYMKFQIRICVTVTVTLNKFLKNRDDFYAIAVAENKTTSACSTKTVVDKTKSILGPLDKVQNQTVRDALASVSGTVLSVTSLIDQFNLVAYQATQAFLTAQNTAITTLVGNFQTTVSAILASLSGVTDANLIPANYAKCEKIAFDAIDAIIKNATTYSDKCFKSLEIAEKTFMDQVKAACQLILKVALIPLESISNCLKNNKLSDAKSIDATTNCTRDTFLICLAAGQIDATAFVSTNYNLLAAAITTNSTQRSTDFGACYSEVWTFANTAATQVGADFIKCVTGA